jgi:hypothetical protein
LDDWCTSKRLDQLCRDLGPAYEHLLWSGQTDSVVRGWVRHQLVDEAIQHKWFDFPLKTIDPQSCPTGWPIVLHQAWQHQETALLAWAEHHWSKELESLYLARKSQLDCITLRLLRVSDQGLSVELYHRIKEGEASFEQLSWEYGEGKERFKAGLIKNQPLDRLPGSLIPLLNNLKTYELQQPRRVGNRYALYQLIERHPSVFDQDTRNELLMEQLACWEVPLVERLTLHLSS